MRHTLNKPSIQSQNCAMTFSPVDCDYDPLYPKMGHLGGSPKVLSLRKDHVKKDPVLLALTDRT